ncbi:MAG TPA: YdeI/OmpD-associated family protein, partial [Roseiflexaceae bacterium]|nr:YdeI/OmpD-associated family protein [Roseiflexaceae bacterium]
ALCYGWIDGQKKSHDEASWLQKFTPRGAKSIWSKVNREKALSLIESGQMQPAGLAAVESAKQDGRWEAAYDSQSAAGVPDDLQAELDRNPTAKAFFSTLNSRNRYAILFRIQTAKKAETRAKRIQEFVGMLERHEKLYP